MIAIHNTHKRYADVHALRGVTLDIERGEVVGVLGPNGAGKSTCVRMVTGAIPPTSGTVSVDGLDTVDDSGAVRARVGYLPEANPLYPEMRTIDYLRFRARLYALPGARRDEAIGRVMGRCAIQDVARQRIGTLSKGYRQRVGLAAALLHDPPVLVLDEPTSGLDPRQIVETRALIEELAGERTMLLVSHILPEVERVCSRIVVIAGGRVRADGAPRDLLERGSTVYVLECDRDLSEQLGPLGELETDRPDDEGFVTHRLRSAEDPRPRLWSIAQSAGARVRELHREVLPLERYYLRLIEAVSHEEEAS